MQSKKIRKQPNFKPLKQSETPYKIPENWVWCRIKDVTHDLGKKNLTKHLLI